MTQHRGSNWKLILCVALLGLTAWTAYASAADAGSAACTNKVKNQVAALEKNGRHPSAEVRSNLLVKCSEAEVGLDVEGLFANHSQETPDQKDKRCAISVKFAKAHGFEKSDRSDEALEGICKRLPSSHDPACGFPQDPDTYSERDDQKCKVHVAGITRHDFVAKAEKHAKKPAGGVDQGSDGDSGSGTAQ